MVFSLPHCPTCLLHHPAPFHLSTPPNLSQTVRPPLSWWDYDYHCTINVSGQGDARWLRASGWRLGTFDGEGHQGYDCSTHDHIVYGTYHNESWCAPWSVSLEIYTRNTIDALGGVTYDYWSNKDATSFACNTLWSGWESA